ncbi:MAG: UbiA family prenyltransferase, partial [Chloroflexota bacterium]
AVCGTYFVQTHTIGIPVVWAGFGIGLLITNILVVNNLRDIETDRSAGKVTLAVRLGVRGSRLEYLLSLMIAYAIPIILFFIDRSYSGSFFSWLSIPLAIRATRELFKFSGCDLNQTLTVTARLALLYALLFSVGILLIH